MNLSDDCLISHNKSKTTSSIFINLTNFRTISSSKYTILFLAKPSDLLTTLTKYQFVMIWR